MTLSSARAFFERLLKEGGEQDDQVQTKKAQVQTAQQAQVSYL